MREIIDPTWPVFAVLFSKKHIHAQFGQRQLAVVSDPGIEMGCLSVFPYLRAPVTNSVNGSLEKREEVKG